MIVKTGLYQHYKGNEYFVFQIATHSETGEHLVFYRCLYGDYSWWVRPLTMFLEKVTVEGELTPRFEFVRELSPIEERRFLAQSVEDTL